MVGEVWNHIGVSWVSLMGNLPTIYLKLANLEQTEGLHPVFPIPWPKVLLRFLVLLVMPDFLKVCRVGYACFINTKHWCILSR